MLLHFRATGIIPHLALANTKPNFLRQKVEVKRQKEKERLTFRGQRPVNFNYRPLLSNL
jgi:hypothetical protein